MLMSLAKSLEKVYVTGYTYATLTGHVLQSRHLDNREKHAFS